MKRFVYCHVGISGVEVTEQVQTTQGECRFGSMLFSFVHEFQRSGSAFSGGVELNLIRDDDDIGEEDFIRRGGGAKPIGMLKIRHREAEIRFRINEAVAGWNLKNQQFCSEHTATVARPLGKN